MQVIEEGSVRIDLLGGTLDLPPIDLILDSRTLNFATSLKARVEIDDLSEKLISINSKDYSEKHEIKIHELSRAINNPNYKNLEFVLRILNEFSITKGLSIELSSGSPAGAGLGGSSSMGVTLYKALSRFFSKDYDPIKTIQIVRNIESIILNRGPAGYQDYFPALYGGVLSIKSHTESFMVEQLSNQKIESLLNDHITLVFSGVSRNSGINNWEVYKSFFDNDLKIREGFSKICDLTEASYKNLKNENFKDFFHNIIQEGKIRKSLFSGIVPKEIQSLEQEVINSNSNWGVKMCGAGGGGCFIIIHPDLKKNSDEYSKSLIPLIQTANMQILDFIVAPIV